MVAAHTCLLSVVMALSAVTSTAQSRPLSEPAQPDAPSGVWNQWRGPNRDGHCPGDWWPERLTKDNVQRLWRVELGPSYSGPIVDETTVYTTETVGKQDEVVTLLSGRQVIIYGEHRSHGDGSGRADEHGRASEMGRHRRRSRESPKRVRKHPAAARSVSNDASQSIRHDA